MRRPGIAWLGIAVLALVLVALGLQRSPFPAVSGTSIHSPSKWKDSSSTRLRVSTYNIHRGVGMDGKKDVSRILELVKNDDISGLQEVLGPSLFGSVDQSETLAREMDSGWFFAPTQTRFNRIYTGNALLSRFEVKAWTITPLLWSDSSDTLTSRRHRNRITADVMLSDIPVKIMVTHLDRGKIRESQLQNLLSEFDNHDHIILLGDLNTNPGSLEIADWIKNNPDADVISASLGSDDLPYRVDWILARGFRLLSGGFSEPGPSDHPYYWAELELITSK